MTTESIREVISRLGASATALAALAAAMEAQVSDGALHPRLHAPLARLLDAVGAREPLAAASAEELRPLLIELRHFWHLDDALLREPQRVLGWSYDDGEILETGGRMTRGLASALPRVGARLEGLLSALRAPGAAFLDVGAGVAGLSIAMSEQFPSLRVVGLEPHGPSLQRAREHVASAGRAERVTIREQAVETLEDESAYDLAWVPLPFLPAHLHDAALARVRRALRPGGWILVASARAAEDLVGSAMAFRVTSWGGEPRTQAEVESSLVAARFGDVQALPGPPNDFKVVIAARRGA